MSGFLVARLPDCNVGKSNDRLWKTTTFEFNGTAFRYRKQGIGIGEVDCVRIMFDWHLWRRTRRVPVVVVFVAVVVVVIVIVIVVVVVVVVVLRDGTDMDVRACLTCRIVRSVTVRVSKTITHQQKRYQQKSNQAIHSRISQWIESSSSKSGSLVTRVHKTAGSIVLRSRNKITTAESFTRGSANSRLCPRWKPGYHKELRFVFSIALDAAPPTEVAAFLSENCKECQFP